MPTKAELQLELDAANKKVEIVDLLLNAQIVNLEDQECTFCESFQTEPSYYFTIGSTIYWLCAECFQGFVDLFDLLGIKYQTWNSRLQLKR